MRKVVLSIFAFILLVGGAWALVGKPSSSDRLKSASPRVEEPKIETVWLFSPSLDRYDATKGVAGSYVAQPTSTVWPEAPKPKPKKQTASAADLRIAPTTRSAKRTKP
jgi:hypothetical protein